MAKGPPFIDREVFEALIAEVPTAKGDGYQDIATIYRDMSRLVVTWLARTNKAELQSLYNAYGWGGNANVRALQTCARAWLKKHHPELAHDLSD